jgi:hypothetical protein
LGERCVSWSSHSHNLKVVGSNVTPATTFTKQLHCVISHSKGAACVGDSGVEALRVMASSLSIGRTTSNPIESVFATVRHRTVSTKGALSQKSAKLMDFTLIQAASKKWLRLKGRNQLPKVIEEIKVRDGVEVNEDTKNRAA